MATIEQLLSITAAEIAAMNDEQLAEWLKDIKDPEPKPPSNKPLVESKDQKKLKRKKKDDDDDDQDQDDNPIKLRVKKEKKQQSVVDLINEMTEFLNENDGEE